MASHRIEMHCIVGWLRGCMDSVVVLHRACTDEAEKANKASALGPTSRSTHRLSFFTSYLPPPPKFRHLPPPTTSQLPPAPTFRTHIPGFVVRAPFGSSFSEKQSSPVAGWRHSSRPGGGWAGEGGGGPNPGMVRGRVRSCAEKRKGRVCVLARVRVCERVCVFVCVCVCLCVRVRV